MRVLTPADYRVMAWKNGAGTTTEIAVDPPGAALADLSFLWRISIAEVRASGAFSLFPGYDRTILLLEGGGMMLDTPEGGAIDLAQPLRPQTFPGEWQVTGRLLTGPVRDFNLMTARAHVTSRLDVLTLTRDRRAHCPPRAQLFVYVVAGRLRDAPAGHTLIAGHDLDLTPVGRATVIRVAIANTAQT